VKFSDQFLDELKSRLRLSDVIGKTVKLRRQGREFVGLSPFTKEKTPSFFVNDDKGFYHDFSSGKHGDLIDFLQETERLSFPEAVERLAREAGVSMPAPDARSSQAEEQRATLGSWLQLASQWYQQELRRPVGQGARTYLEKRGFGDAELQRFSIGYAPNSRTGLKDFLVAKGARPGDLVRAGLLVAPDDGASPYDRFRDRIIFPINDQRGRVISFGGRALSPDARAKYLNGPDSDLFDKGQVLYGFAEARTMLRAPDRADDLVVVEGYFDTLACLRAGIPAVAPMGTSLTESQIEALWRLHPEPTLCFDGDNAGRLAAGRAIDRVLPLLKADRTFKFAVLLGGKDADEVFRERGADALKAQLAQTTTLIDAVFRREFDAFPLDTPERRASLKGRLRRAAGSVFDKDVSEQYRNALLDRFYEYSKGRRFAGANSAIDLASAAGAILDRQAFSDIRDRVRTLSAAVYVAATEHPDWIAPHIEELDKFGVGDPELVPLVQPLIDALQEASPTAELVRTYLEGDEVTGLWERTQKFAREVGGYPFLSRSMPEQAARSMWLRCFKTLSEFSSIELEKRERRKAFEHREPVPESAKLGQRSVWLRKHELRLLQSINSGELWSLQH
jgi:DNA primase